MTKCRECLNEIVWVDRSDGRGRFPAEYVTTKDSGLWVLIPRTLTVAQEQPPIVKRHSCRPNEPFPEFVNEFVNEDFVNEFVDEDSRDWQGW